MTDIFDQEKRSSIMRSVKSTDTSPEMVVRKWLHARGYGYRIHRKDLPGKPDITMSRLKLAIFVHGCFWHNHTNCRKATIPKTRTEFWTEKFKKNKERDKQKEDALEKAGWRILVLWQCEIEQGKFADILQESLSELESSLGNK